MLSYGTLRKQYPTALRYLHIVIHIDYVYYFRTLQATNKINGATKDEEHREVADTLNFVDLNRAVKLTSKLFSLRPYTLFQFGIW